MSEGYSETTLEYYESQPNRGLLSRADVTALRTNPICGDTLRLTLNIADEHIVEAGFEVDGCVAATAAAAAMSELILGRSLAETAQIGAAEIDSALGGLPAGRAHGALLAAETLAAALASFQPERAGPLT